MAKGLWKPLMQCRDCYRIMNKITELDPKGDLIIYAYDNPIDFNQYTDQITNPPLVVFNLKLEHIKRPYGQQNRKILSIFDDRSQRRCSEKLADAQEEYYMGIWLSQNAETLIEDLGKQGIEDPIADYRQFLDKKWKSDKRKDLKEYLLTQKSEVIYHRKSCNVDFYLDEDDSHGLIYHLLNRKKLPFVRNGDKLEYISQTRLKEEKSLKNKISFERIIQFIAEIYSNKELKLIYRGLSRLVPKIPYEEELT